VVLEERAFPPGAWRLRRSLRFETKIFCGRLFPPEQLTETPYAGVWHTQPTRETDLPQTITRSIRDLIADANQAVRVLDVGEAREMHGRDDVIFIDLRDIREVAKTGTVAGAHHVPRGMLEFWIDPDSPYHQDIFAEDRKFVFFCAGGWRSALAAKAAADMGLKPVAHMAGGFGAWKEAEGPVEDSDAKTPKG